jgi:hypothetical protein
MNKEKNNKIEQILNSLDDSQRAAAPDFFITRLKARMERKEETHSKRWILRPAYALATLVVVLIINIAIILNGEQATDSDNNSDSETVQSIAAEYSLNDNNIMYDLTLDK